jgi:acyl-CoA thioesterase-1
MLQLAVLIMIAAGIAASSCHEQRSAASPSAPPNPASIATYRIVVLGDSLAVSPTPPESFPAHLHRRVEAAGLPWTVVNAGVRGDTTAGGLRRFSEAVPGDTHILVLALGANDGLRGVPVSTITSNLSQIIERAQERGIRVLLCGMETPPSGGWEYTLAFHRIFPVLATRYGLPLVPFLLAGVALNAALNGPDHVHPNAEGARRIAETVWTYLEPMIRQPTATATRPSLSMPALRSSRNPLIDEPPPDLIGNGSH